MTELLSCLYHPLLQTLLVFINVPNRASVVFPMKSSTVFHELEENVILSKTVKVWKIHLFGQLNYVVVEILSISIRILERLTFSHPAAEGGCQQRLAVFDG
jgi:hypothetical protein